MKSRDNALRFLSTVLGVIRRIEYHENRGHELSEKLSLIYENIDSAENPDRASVASVREGNDTALVWPPADEPEGAESALTVIDLEQNPAASLDGTLSSPASPIFTAAGRPPAPRPAALSPSTGSDVRHDSHRQRRPPPLTTLARGGPAASSYSWELSRRCRRW